MVSAQKVVSQFLAMAMMCECSRDIYAASDVVNSVRNAVAPLRPAQGPPGSTNTN